MSTTDARYVPCVAGVRSELVIPLIHQDRCIGVFDLASPELAAFTKRHVEILTPLANHTAVAIENARLYEAVAANEARLEKEVRFAQRVQMALLPQELPKRLRGVDVAARFEPARELGGDFHDFLDPEPSCLVVAVGDVSGKGAPAALYSAFAGELLRGRTFRRRYTTVRSTPAGVLASMNTILHERQLEEYFCTLCYASFDFKRRIVTVANSGLPYPIRCTVGLVRADRHSRRAAGIVRRFGVRRGDVPARSGRCVRDLLGRHLRGDERARRGVRLSPAPRRRRTIAGNERPGDRGCDLRGSPGLPRHGGSERRHDRRRRQDPSLHSGLRHQASGPRDQGSDAQRPQGPGVIFL